MNIWYLDFKNSILGWFFFWGVYLKSYNAVLLCSISCFIEQIFKFLTLTSFFYNPLGRRFWATGEVIKNYLMAFCSHIDSVSVQNLESVALMVSGKRCLDMTDGRTWLTRFLSSCWSRIYILYRVLHVSFDLWHTFCLN